MAVWAKVTTCEPSASGKTAGVTMRQCHCPLDSDILRMGVIASGCSQVALAEQLLLRRQSPRTYQATSHGLTHIPI